MARAGLAACAHSPGPPWPGHRPPQPPSRGRPACAGGRRRAGLAARLLDAGLGLHRNVVHAVASHPAAQLETSLGRSITRTLAYAAPEIVGRTRGPTWVGPHSDIFSFGKLCAFALTGRADPDEAALVHLPEAWRTLIAECSAWVVARRPTHVNLVLERLAELAGEGIIDRLEADLHAQGLARNTATIEANPANVEARLHGAVPTCGTATMPRRSPISRVPWR